MLQQLFSLQLTSANCPAAATLTARYNDLDSVRAVFKENKDQIAGIMLEPVVGNSGYIAPTQEFLQVGRSGQGSYGSLRSSGVCCLWGHNVAGCPCGTSKHPKGK